MIWIQSHQDTDSGEWVHVCQYGPLTPAERMISQLQRDTIDPATLDAGGAASLDGENTRVVIDTNATVPTPPTVSGKVCWKHWTERRGKVQYIHMYLYRYRSSVKQIEADHYQLLVDGSGLRSTATTAEVYVAGSPPADPGPSDFGLDASFVLLDHEDSNTLNPGFVLRVFHWALVDTKTQIENQETEATADTLSLYTRRTTTLVAVTGTAAEMADDAQAANLSDSTYRRARVQIINADWAKQMIETSGEDQKYIDLGGSYELSPIRGLPVAAISDDVDTVPAAAFGDTAAYIKVKVYGTAAGGNGYREFVPTNIRRFRGSFMYRRVFITDTPGDYYNLDLQLSVNDDVFLGWPANWVSYVRPRLTYDYAIGDDHLLVIDYVFEVDSAMFLNDGDLVIGNAGFNDSPHVTSSGYVAATSFDATALVRWPGTNDFSVFTA